MLVFQTPEHEGMSPRQSDQVFVTDRSCTDILALILLIGLVIGFVRTTSSYPLSFSPVSTLFRLSSETRFPVVCAQGFLLSVVVQKGDIYRVINGYDDCANVCGRVTSSESNPEFSCKGADKTKER